MRELERDEAARRVERFQTTLNPAVLWPGVDEHHFRAALEEIVRVTSGVLTAPEDGGHEVREVAARNMKAFGAAAFASGLGPLLGYWIEAARLAAPTAVTTLLAEHLDHGRRRAARLRRELERLVSLFRGQGIEVTVLKGMHTAWEYFPDPGVRPCADIDLLLSADAAAGERVLARAGFVEHSRVPERSTWRPPGWSHPVSFDLTHVDNPWDVDLHQTLDRQSAGAAAEFGPLDEADREPWDVGGVPVWTLAQPLRACFSAVHAADHLPHLPPLRLVELVVMLRRDRSAPFWAALAERFERSGTGAFGYAALKLVEDLAPGTVDPSVLDALRGLAPPHVRRVLSRLTPPAAFQMYHSSYEGRFLWASGIRRWAAIAAWAWPTDGHGKRVPLTQAIALAGLRLRRLTAGRYRRSVP